MQGGWMGGSPPYGYKIESSRLVAEEKEKEWVKFIFEKYRDGNSIDEIRTGLLHNGVLTRRGNVVWSHGSIDKLLTNTHYAGYYNFTDKKDGKPIRTACPSILSPSLIKEVSEVKEQRGYKRSGSKRVKTSTQKYIYLLKDLLVCGHCGSRYGGNHKQSQTSYYSCNQKTNKFRTTYTDRYVECGSNRNIRIDKADDLVWNTVADVLGSSYTFKNQIHIATYNGSYDEPKEDIKSINNKIKKLDSDINLMTSTIVNFEANKLVVKDDQRIEDIILNLEGRLIGLKAEKEKLTNKLLLEDKNDRFNEWMLAYTKLRINLDHLKDSIMDLEGRKKFLDNVIDKITVTNIGVREHELLIEFRLPYVGDEFIYDTETNKKVIKNGQKIKKIRCNLLKKS